MCKTIAIANQKGGVAKTTTAVNLGTGLVKCGCKTLLIDADPQGSLSQGCNIGNPDALETTLSELMSYEMTGEDKDYLLINFDFAISSVSLSRIILITSSM